MTKEQITAWLRANGRKVGSELNENPLAMKLFRCAEMWMKLPQDGLAELFLIGAIEKYEAAQSQHETDPTKGDKP